MGGAWAQTQPSEGDGSSEHPFLINTAEELKWYASYVNGESGDNVVHTTACAKLMNNIDLSTVCGEGKGNWTPIAKYGIYKYQGRRIKLRCPPKVLTGTLHPIQPSIFSS